MAQRFDLYDFPAGASLRRRGAALRGALHERMRHGRMEMGEASHAHALALCSRAAAAVDHASALSAAHRTHREVAREARVRADALRALGTVRRGGRSVGASVSLAVTPARRDAGRVVRPVPPRRQAAASAGTTGDGLTPQPRWAQATVYASRTVQGAEAGVPCSGLPSDPAAAATWTVRELDAREMPGNRASRCLVFENHEIVRRVWSFPETWLTLPAGALFQLAGLLP